MIWPPHHQEVASLTVGLQEISLSFDFESSTNQGLSSKGSKLIHRGADRTRGSTPPLHLPKRGNCSRVSRIACLATASVRASFPRVTRWAGSERSTARCFAFQMIDDVGARLDRHHRQYGSEPLRVRFRHSLLAGCRHDRDRPRGANFFPHKVEPEMHAVSRQTGFGWEIVPGAQALDTPAEHEVVQLANATGRNPHIEGGWIWDRGRPFSEGGHCNCDLRPGRCRSGSQ